MKAKTEFEKHFYKLMNNTVYGRIIKYQKRLKLDLIEKSDTHRILNRQSKCSFDDKIAKFGKFISYSFDKESIKFTQLFMLDFVY